MIATFTSATRRIAAATLGITGLLLVVGCAVVAPPGKRVPLSAGEKAHVTPSIRSALLRARAESTIVIDTQNRYADLAVVHALEHAGALHATGAKAYAVTPLGLASSNGCDRRPATRLRIRCFAVAKTQLVDVQSLTLQPAQLDAAASRNYWFSFTSRPFGPIGRALAAQKSLVCTDVAGRDVPWTGQGVYYATYAERVDQTNATIFRRIESSCPRSPISERPQTPAPG